MRTRWRTASLRFALAAITVAASLIAAVVLPLTSSASPSIGQLSSQLDQQRAKAQSLSSSVGGLSQTIASLDGQISLVQSREAAVRADLAADRAKLAAVQQSLDGERRQLALLTAKLARARQVLSSQLVTRYESDNPDLVGVILEANGFNDLLERVDFLKRAQHQEQSVVQATRDAKAKADSAARQLAQTEEADRRVTASAASRAAALAGMNQLLQSKQAAVSQARAAQQAELQAAKAKAGALQGKISSLQAQQAAAAQRAAAAAGAPSSSAAAAVPSGGWAIPSAIVMCESGGQNLPPNSAGASGYYQIIPSTWSSFGGSGPAAYLSSKAEQDAVASRIYNGGAGVSNWVCAGMVGIH
jgi:peptidoglycan hydrolase CwlO-like protein